MNPSGVIDSVELRKDIATADGRAITAVLHVSPDGNGLNGLTWQTAFTTIQAALAAASTDANDCTKIWVAPHATNYDILTADNPTFTGNYEISGTHRIWAAIKNTHASATSVMKFTGKVSLENLAIFQVADEGGVIITGNGWRIRRCGFNSTAISGAATSVYIDGTGATTRGGIMEDVEFLGDSTFTTGLHIEASTINEIRNVTMHDCIVGIHVEDAASDRNLFQHVDIGDCNDTVAVEGADGVAIKITSGNEQHFDNILLHDNTINVSDAIGDSAWDNIHGQFEIDVEPNDFAGVTLAADDVPNAWGADTEIRAAATATVPFRIVGVHFEPDISQWYGVRLSADSGATHFDEFLFDGNKREGAAAPAGTEFIFNKGTKISGGAKAESDGEDTVNIWLEIQEI